jgi:hypothetical protein
MSKSPRQHPVTLQGKLKLNEQEKVQNICKFYYNFQYSIVLVIKPLSATDLG